MISILRQVVFLRSVLLTLLGIILMLAQNHVLQKPIEIRIAMLFLIFLLGVILIIVIAKNGLGE